MAGALGSPRADQMQHNSHRGYLGNPRRLVIRFRSPVHSVATGSYWPVAVCCREANANHAASEHNGRFG